ncbi:hypothetical protein CPLU01_13245 [Colletotrichum plurivorum]|uniref:Heterokaryon incompatibility domain-containing protein n=1 Tax=Colletotrichum plurivorum TaxID=2175906 RepID=A0A8H6JTD9_9PEZI|nr:hypothetical protein CPLU01_13245 [Colletotrichum plurivorum]
MTPPRLDTDDRNQSLRSIASEGGRSLVSQLLDIQTAVVEQSKSLQFIKELDCLYLNQSRKRAADAGDPHAEHDRPVWKRERGVDALVRSDYVAVSWTWDVSEDYEDQTAGGHLVENADGQLQSSDVRDQIFERIRRYVEAQGDGLEYVWLDRHCICQEPGEEKNRGMQAMDLVYGHSDHPIALLARPIASREELGLLAEIIRGNLICKSSSADFALGSAAVLTPLKLSDALELLDAITSDLWWSRAWTFQENYRSEAKMKLLIPHSRELESRKKHEEDLFGSILGELSIQSLKFHKQVTRLCLACQRQRPDLADTTDRILKRASNYEVLLRDTAPGAQYLTRWSQSPMIIKDVEPRGSKYCSDRLAIVANCCQYSTRLDEAALRRGEHSISFAMLGLYLLNGEMMKNPQASPKEIRAFQEMTVSTFIEEESFDGFCPPGSKNPLVFNNGCRFINVELTEDGIETAGHLWKLHRVIQTHQFPIRGPASQEKSRDAHRHVIWRLNQLQHVLKMLGYHPLARQLGTFVHRSLRSRIDGSFSQAYMRTMARMVVAAIDAQKPLCLGGLLEGGDDIFMYKGIFVLDDYDDIEVESQWGPDTPSYFEDDVPIHRDGDDSLDSESNTDDDTDIETGSLEAPVFVFTSSKPRKEPSATMYPNDIDKHVSIEVNSRDLENGYYGDGLRPKLFTERWIHGLCFFGGHSRQPVLFPWHPALLDVE